MNVFEKFGLLLILIYFGHTYPESWKGVEIVLFMFGSMLFFLGANILEWLAAYKEIE